MGIFSESAVSKAKKLYIELELNRLQAQQLDETQARLKKILDSIIKEETRYSLAPSERAWLVGFKNRAAAIKQQPQFPRNLSADDTAWYKNHLNIKIAKLCKDLGYEHTTAQPQEQLQVAIANSVKPEIKIEVPVSSTAAATPTNDDRDRDYSVSTSSARSAASSISSDSSFSDTDEKHADAHHQDEPTNEDHEEDNDVADQADQFETVTLTTAITDIKTPQPALSAVKPTVIAEPVADIKKPTIDAINDDQFNAILKQYNDKFGGFFKRKFASHESRDCREAMKREKIVATLMKDYDCEKRHLPIGIVEKIRFDKAQAYLANPANLGRGFALELQAAKITYKPDYRADFYHELRAEIDALKAKDAHDQQEKLAQMKEKIEALREELQAAIDGNSPNTDINSLRINLHKEEDDLAYLEGLQQKQELFRKLSKQDGVINQLHIS